MLTFSKIYKEDLGVVGKKAVELAEIARLGIPIPDGFVILPNFNLSESLVKETHDAYKKLSGVFKETSLNIISSPSSNSKFIMFKNVKGDVNLILKIKEIHKHHSDKAVAIVVQKNIQSKIKGTLITNRPSGNKDLDQLSQKIQKHFYFPQEIEYVVEKGKVLVTHIKPFTETVKELVKKNQNINNFRKAIIKGISINPGIVTGAVRLINSRHFADVKNSEIAVIKNFDKDLSVKIKNARGVVIGAMMHSPIDKLCYRKLIKSPTIANTQDSIKLLQNGNVVTINGATGEIYAG